MNDRQLISNLHSETASIEVADGFKHPTIASSPLSLVPSYYPHIHTNYVPSFSNNLIGISTIIDRGAVGIIHSNKMTLVRRSSLVDKILNFVLKYSNDNNLIILTSAPTS